MRLISNFVVNLFMTRVCSLYIVYYERLKYQAAELAPDFSIFKPIILRENRDEQADG